MSDMLRFKGMDINEIEKVFSEMSENGFRCGLDGEPLRNMAGAIVLLCKHIHKLEESIVDTRSNGVFKNNKLYA